MKGQATNSRNIVIVIVTVTVIEVTVHIILSVAAAAAATLNITQVLAVWQQDAVLKQAKRWPPSIGHAAIMWSL